MTDPTTPTFDEQESDQRPESQPAPAHPGAPSDPQKRKQDVGLDPTPAPGSRRNTGNPNDEVSDVPTG